MTEQPGLGEIRECRADSRAREDTHWNLSPGVGRDSHDGVCLLVHRAISMGTYRVAWASF